VVYDILLLYQIVQLSSNFHPAIEITYIAFIQFHPISVLKGYLYYATLAQIESSCVEKSALQAPKNT